jgi:hypothetical protein
MVGKRHLGVCCLALALPALVAAGESGPDRARAAGGSAGATAAAGACAETPVTVDPEYVWRIRAERQLDCVVQIVDEALRANKGGVVTLSREDAERLRAMALWAKDSAARIGR